MVWFLCVVFVVGLGYFAFGLFWVNGCLLVGCNNLLFLIDLT